MTRLLAIACLSALLLPAIAEAADRPAAAESGQRRITGRLELFPDGRIVRTQAPLPAPARPPGPGHAAPPAARLPADVAAPRFSPGRR